MFVIKGIDKIKEVIEKNRERKILKKKKISNNRIIEIDNISPLKLLKLQENLAKITKEEDIKFEIGKGKKKPEIQKLYEEIQDCGKRLMKYKENFKIMGKDRNSYSKTDLEATFMRMKDDHMRNGQLKPAYNVQIAVENYFIIHTYVSSDRTDYNTLIPVVKHHNGNLKEKLKEVTADSGYCSEQNLLYLKEKNIRSYIKLQSHEKQKTKAYKEDISKYYNMKKVTENGKIYYICHNKRKLEYIQTQKVKRRNFLRTLK